MLEKLARLWPRRAAAAREQKAAYGSFVAIEGLATPAWATVFTHLNRAVAKS